MLSLLSLLAGCATEDAAPEAAIPWVATTAPSQRLDLGPDGAVLGVRAGALGASLFSADARGDFTPGFESWILANRRTLGFAPARAVPSELTYTHSRAVGGLTMVRYAQTYQGLRLLGAAGTVTLVTDGAEVRSVMGQLVDARETWTGVRSRLSDREALLALDTAMARQYPGAAYTVEGLELVALPWSRSLGFEGSVTLDGVNPVVVLIDAVSGGYLADHPEPISPGPNEYQPIPTEGHVQAMSVSEPWIAPPVSPGDAPDQWTAVSHYYDVPWHDHDVQGTQTEYVRLGNGRVRIFDWDDGVMPRVASTFKRNIFTQQISVNFIDDPGDPNWRSQEMFHKAWSMMRIVDAWHQNDWDYDCQGLLCAAHVEPILYLNVGAEQISSDNQYLPMVFNVDPVTAQVIDLDFIGLTIDNIFIRMEERAAVPTLFHELGHYYDAHNDYGMMQNADPGGPCSEGVQESRASAEMTADMIALATVAEVYPNIAYDEPDPIGQSICNLGVFTDSGALHHPDCHGAKQFADDRPAAGGCDVHEGYHVQSVQQATWEYVKGWECVGEVCNQVTNDPAPLIPGLLAAWSAGNVQSPESYFTHVRDALATDDVAEAERFQRIFEHHGVSF